MKISLNSNYNNLVKSYLFSETGRRIREYSAAHPDKKVIKLSIGDVTLPLTKTTTEALIKAAREMGKAETFHGYPPEYGYDFLKNAVAEHYKSISGINVPADEIFISDGAKSDLGNITDVLGCNPTLIPDPVYPVYVDSNIMNNNPVTFIPSTKANSFTPSPDDIPAPAKNIPAVIYLCSPNNPTGAAYKREQLIKWVNYANSTGSLIIFDSAYEAYVSDPDTPHSVYQIPNADSCTIEVCSLSKSSGFTGTRCGWTVIPKKLASDNMSLNEMWARRQATKFNGVSYPTQRAAEAALSPQGRRESLELVHYYMENAKMIASTLEKKDIPFSGGKNSPYIWMEIPDNMPSWKFFDYLLETAQIAGTPGAGFGVNGEGYFRLTAFGTHENTKEACERLEKIL